MVYAEWLRIRNCLRCYAYVLLAIFILVIVLRIAANGAMDVNHWRNKAFDPGAHYTTQTLPGGTTRTVIDDANHEHIVIDDHGWFGKHITITDGPIGERDIARTSNRQFGMFSVEKYQGRHSTVQVIDTIGHPIDLGYLFAFSTLFGLIFATIFGAPLARENDDHLEVVFTKPVSRTRFALETVLADLAAIFGAFVMTVVAALACVALFQLPSITVGAPGLLLAFHGLIAAFAWYAMFLAITSTMKRGRGAVLGLAWPVGLFVPGLALLPLGDSALGQVVHTIFRGLALIDPLAYVNLNVHSFDEGGAITTTGIFGFSVETGALVLLALAIVYLAAGIIQWQRVEA